MSNILYDAQVAYLESTGTQYIDTGFKPNQDTRIVATMQCVTSTSYGRLFGSGTYNTLNSVMIDYETGITGTLHIKYGNNSSWTNVSSIHGDYETHIYDFNKNNFYLDNELVSSNTYGAFQSISNLGIFTYINGNNVGQNTEFFTGRLYSFQIYDNDVLIRDYIPVRVGEIGYLYDKVNEELFSNAGTGNFTLGNDVISGFVSSFRRRLLSTYRAPLPNYLCFTALEDGTFTFRIGSNVGTGELQFVEYSTDGATWERLTNVASTEVSITTPTITASNKVYWRGEGSRCGKDIIVNKTSNFSSTGTFDVSGCLVSLLKNNTFDETTGVSGNSQYHFSRLFTGCTGLRSAHDLILASNTKPHIYNGLFYSCTSLVDTPKFIDTTTEQLCYQCMFYGCSSLLAVQGDLYLSNNVRCCDQMFYGCSSLVSAPKLTPTTLPSYAYNSLFRGTKVNWIMMLGTSIGSYALYNWVYGVPNTSDGIFVKHINATWTTTGNNGVPSNWTIIYYDPALDKYYTDQTRATECDDHGNPI